jgi:methionyl-tRNA formyltransferase
VKLWQAVPVAGSGEIGRILSVDRDSIRVACGEGALAVSGLQRAGGKRLAVREFLAGHPLRAGDRFDVVA